MTSMSGTAWTGPGQGATGQELFDWLDTTRDPLLTHMAKCELGPRVWNESVGDYDYSRRFNLALTGEPLTSEDVRRIAVAK